MAKFIEFTEYDFLEETLKNKRMINIDTITENDANTLIEKKENAILGKYKEKEISVKDGKFGKYILYDGKNYSIPKKEGEGDEIGEDITLEAAIEIIEKKDNNTIKVFNATTKIMKGPYGFYIASGKKFVSIPKNISENDCINMTLKECKEIIDNYKPKQYSGKNSSKKE